MRERRPVSQRPSLARRVGAFFGVYVALWVLPWVVLFAVVLTAPGALFPRMSLPQEAYRADRCTWHCHNHGCRHRAVLPAALSGDRGLFGMTIRALFSAGRGLARDRGRGYGAANLLLFCLAWPALMYALWVIAWRQRAALRALERGP